MLFHDKQCYLNMKPNLPCSIICLYLIYAISSNYLVAVLYTVQYRNPVACPLPVLCSFLFLNLCFCSYSQMQFLLPTHYDCYVTNCCISQLLTLQYSRKTSLTALNSILKFCTCFIYNKISLPNDIFHSLKSNVLLSCNS